MKVTLDEDQAQLILDMVEADAASIISPLPATAKGVIITAAARACPNPSGATSMSSGGASASWSPGGIYLTRSERNTLRRLAGKGGGAFSVNAALNAGKHYHRDPLRPGANADDREQFAFDQDLP